MALVQAREGREGVDLGSEHTLTCRIFVILIDSASYGKGFSIERGVVNTQGIDHQKHIDIQTITYTMKSMN